MNVLYFFCGGFTRSSFWSFLMTAILPGLSDVAFRLTCSCSPVDNTKQLHDLVFFFGELPDTLWCCSSFW